MRCCHGDDELYTRSARRARELWLELGDDLLVECGVAWFARRADGWEAEGERVMREQGIPVERLSPARRRRAVPEPSHRRPGLRAARARGRRAAGGGGHARARRPCPEAAAPGWCGAKRGPMAGRCWCDGARLEADLVVWACGAWLASLFPGLVELRVTLQPVAFFEAPAPWQSGEHAGLRGLRRRRLRRGAARRPWPEARASTRTGRRWIPSRRPAEADAEAIAKARVALAHRFPALADAPLERSETCHYSITADMGFICDRHPEHEHVWLAGGGSGHGFKHGPAFAERAVAAMTGAARPSLASRSAPARRAAACARPAGSPARGCAYGRRPRASGPAADLHRHQLVRPLRPVAQQRAGVARVDDLLDAEALGGAERGAHGVQALANLLAQRRRVVGRLELAPVGRLDAALDRQRAPVARGPGVAQVQARVVAVRGAGHAEHLAHQHRRPRARSPGRPRTSRACRGGWCRGARPRCRSRSRAGRRSSPAAGGTGRTGRRSG